MKIKAEIVFTYGAGDAIRKGPVPSGAPTEAYVRKVVEQVLEDLKGTVNHDHEDDVRIRITSAKIVD